MVYMRSWISQNTLPSLLTPPLLPLLFLLLLLHLLFHLLLLLLLFLLLFLLLLSTMKAGGSFKSLRLSLKSPGKRVLWNRGVHLEPCNNNPTTETVSEDHATCSSCALLFEPNNADLATEPVQDEAYPAHDPPPYSPRPFRYRPLFGQGDGPELETSYVQNLSLVAAQAWMPIVKGTRETDTADTQTVRRWLTYFSMKVAMKIVLQCPVMVCWHRVLNDLCVSVSLLFGKC